MSQSQSLGPIGDSLPVLKPVGVLWGLGSALVNAATPGTLATALAVLSAVGPILIGVAALINAVANWRRKGPPQP